MLDEGLIACDSLEISPWTMTAERPDSDPSSQRVTSPGPLPPSACREPSYLAGGSVIDAVDFPAPTQPLPTSATSVASTLKQLFPADNLEP